MKTLSVIAIAVCASAVVVASCSQQPGGSDITPEAVGQVRGALSQSEVLPTGGVCAPSGAHGAGANYNGHVTRPCQTCHQCGGVLQFDANSLAGATSFDATTKVCTGGCHTDGRGGPPVVQPMWYGSFPTVTCSTYNGTCGTCNTGPICCNCHQADNTNAYILLQTGHHRRHLLDHIPCVTCHLDPMTSTHANGTINVRDVIVEGSGQNIQTINVYRPANTAPAPYTSVCKGTATCVGTCHGQDHYPVYSFNAGCW